MTDGKWSSRFPKTKQKYIKGANEAKLGILWGKKWMKAGTVSPQLANIQLTSFHRPIDLENTGRWEQIAEVAHMPLSELGYVLTVQHDTP